MNDFLLIAAGAGLQDGLNPCIFMTCAAFIVLGRLRFIFVLAYAISILAFNFGPPAIFVYQKNFIFTAKIIYFVLGAAAFVLGVLFFKDWFLIRRGMAAKDLSDEKIRPFAMNGFAGRLMTVMLAVVLCALATLWPINTYIVLLGSTSILKGQWQVAVPFLLGYALVSMWPLWCVWAFLSIKNLQPSLYKIVCAAVFFTASTCMILIFK